MTLSYEDLYKILEEVIQLKGSNLQRVSRWSENRYELVFFFQKKTRNIIIDLAAARPFFLSTDQTGPKSKAASPILNFLKAHFLNKNLTALEIAQKPNRQLKLAFEDADLVFKCWPHGVHLNLQCQGKRVQSSKDKEPQVSTAFIEPDLVEGWAFNDEICSHFLDAKVNLPKVSSKLEKLQRALAKIDDGLQSESDSDKQLIAELTQKANTASGRELDSIFAKIKKVKTKDLIRRTRRSEVLDEIANIKTAPQTEPLPAPKKGLVFKGLKAKLDDQWDLWVGRSAAQNDELIKQGSPHHFWLHLRDYPGAHGLILGPTKKEPPFAIIEKACLIVAIISQTRKRQFREGESLDFIVTPKKFVKKKRGSPAGQVWVERESVRRIAFRNLKFDVMA